MERASSLGARNAMREHTTIVRPSPPEHSLITRCSLGAEAQLCVPADKLALTANDANASSEGASASIESTVKSEAKRMIYPSLSFGETKQTNHYISHLGLTLR